MDRKDRIRMIMEEQHMTQQVFADFLDQSPATLSSIFNGRTQPTLNIVEAIKKKIPDINTDWLLWGTGDMYVGTTPTAGEAADTVQATPQVGGSEQLLIFDTPSVQPAVQPQPYSSAASAGHYQHGVKNTHADYVREEVKFVDKQPRRVTEIRVYYDDQTYETFVPAKK